MKIRSVLPALVIFFIICPVSLAAESSVIALCYHTFYDGNRSQYDISPDTLEAQIQTMLEMGYTFVSFQEMMEGTVRGTNNILITIDDGSLSVNYAFANVLSRYKIKPLLFIYPGRINKSKALTFDEIRSLIDNGSTIGAHGYSHLKITKNLFLSDNKAFKKEILGAKQKLETVFSYKVLAFAYPYGIVAAESIQEIEASGYYCAFTINYGEIHVPLSDNKDLFRLPRYMVTKSSWPFIEKLLSSRSGLTSSTIIKKQGSIRLPTR